MSLFEPVALFVWSLFGYSRKKKSRQNFGWQLFTDSNNGRKIIFFIVKNFSLAQRCSSTEGFVFLSIVAHRSLTNSTSCSVFQHRPRDCVHWLCLIIISLTPLLVLLNPLGWNNLWFLSVFDLDWYVIFLTSPFHKPTRFQTLKKGDDVTDLMQQRISEHQCMLKESIWPSEKYIGVN